MIKYSRGNAAKDTKRCPACGTENVIALWGRVPKSETRVAHTCLACGHWIILDHAGWDTFWGNAPPSSPDRKAMGLAMKIAGHILRSANN